MSNEEMVVLIQEGRRELMADLWEQVRLFVIKQARRVPLEGRADVELDDLIQSGYLALVDAVADYKPEMGGFLTVLKYRLLTRFAEATRFRSERQQRETLAGALSLDAAVSDEGRSSTLGDFQEDPAAADALEAVEDRIFRAQLREAVADVLGDLPKEQRELLRLRYWEGRTLLELAEARGVAIEGVRQKEKKAIRELRKPKNAVRLVHFYDFDYYGGTGLGAFRSTGTSIQERYLMKKDRIRERNQRRAALDAEMQRIEEEAAAQVARMTPEEKQALLEKYGLV
jgi:RNA polymerase sigma factor (sigma-70 family)